MDYLTLNALNYGYKDYATVNISLKPNRLNTVYPNPTSDQLTVSYQINQGQSAYLAVTPVNGSNTVNNYMIDLDKTTIDLDLSLLSQGAYIVSLIVDGHLTDSTTLIKQ